MSITTHKYTKQNVFQNEILHKSGTWIERIAGNTEL